MKTPLKPFSTAILTALAAGEVHAYGVEQQMIADVQGSILVDSRALYRDIQRLVTDKLIESVPETRPVRYRLTKFGRTILLSERANAERTLKLLQTRL